MPQLRPRAQLSQSLLAACGLLAVLSLASFAAADDTITDQSPQLFFEDNFGTTYEWEILAFDTAFDIFDNTAGTLPFRIEAGAPDASLNIVSDGSVGFGAVNPTAPIHVTKASQALIAESVALFEISDDTVGALEIRNGSTSNGIFHPRLRGTAASQAVPLTMEGLITTDSGTNPVVAYDAARRAGGGVVNRPLVVYRNNGVTQVSIGPTGVVTANSFNPVSSRARKHSITDLDSHEAANALRQLAPVKFIYNDDQTNQKHVGFIAEDVPEVVAAPDRKSVPIMDVLALVTRVVKDQQQTIEEQKKTMGQQQKHIEEQQKINNEQRQLNELLIKRLNDLENHVSTTK